MAIQSGLFRSDNGDRKYTASFFASYFASFIANGVFPNPSTGMQVIADSNLTVNVKAGKGWINGYYLINDADYPLTHDIADSVLNRIDRIVMSLDLLNRTISVSIKKGLPSSTPVAPSLQRDNDVYELGLADVYVAAGTVSITQANITDLRLNTELCGIVRGTVERVDTTTIFNQYQEYFNVWSEQQRQEFESFIDSITDILDDNVAGNLLTLIENQRTDFDNHVKDYVKHPAVVEGLGSNNVYTINLTDAPFQYENGMGLVITMDRESTGNVSLKVNNLPTVPLLRPDGKPAKNIKQNGVYTVRYSSVNSAFILQGEGGLEIENSDTELYVAGENVEGDVVARVVADNTLTNQPTVTFSSLVNTSAIYELSCTEDKSLIAVAMFGTSDYKKLLLFENEEGVLNDITNRIIEQPTANNVQYVKISNDGKYILVGQALLGEFLIIYERDDVSGNYIKNTTLSAFNSLLTNFAKISITPDNKYIFVGTSSSSSLLRLQNNFDGTFTQLTSINIGGNLLALNYRGKDNILFLGIQQSTNNFITYKHNEGTLTSFKQNTVGGGGVSYNTINFIESTDLVAVGTNNSPYLSVVNYDNVNGLLSNVALNGGSPTGNVKYIDSIRNGEYLFVSTDGSTNKFFVYKRSVTSDNTYEKLANPVFPANSNGRLIALTDTDFVYFNGGYFTPYVGLVKKLFRMSSSATNIEELAVPEREATTNERVNAIKIWEA